MQDQAPNLDSFDTDTDTDVTEDYAPRGECAACGKVHAYPVSPDQADGIRGILSNMFIRNTSRADTLNAKELEVIADALRAAADHVLVMGDNTVSDVRTTVEALGLLRMKIDAIASKGGSMTVIPF